MRQEPGVRLTGEASATGVQRTGHHAARSGSFFEGNPAPTGDLQMLADDRMTLMATLLFIVLESMQKMCKLLGT